MQITFDVNPDNAANEIYDLIKTSLETDFLNVSHVEMISELTAELAARKKEESHDIGE